MGARLDRTTMRDALAGLLQTALVDGTTQLAARVERGFPDTFGGQSPVVLVADGGIQRSYVHQGVETYGCVVLLDVFVFVEYVDTPDWTAANVEEAASEIEAAVADVVMTQRSGAAWGLLAYRSEFTQMAIVELFGRQYRREIIPLAAIERSG